MTILIVGGSGGIGFSIVKCFLHYYPGAKVIATYNSNQLDFEHPNLQWYKLDITSEKEIENLSNKIGFIDILVNSAGILHSSTQMPEKTIKNFDLEFFIKT